MQFALRALPQMLTSANLFVAELLFAKEKRRILTKNPLYSVHISQSVWDPQLYMRCLLGDTTIIIIILVTVTVICTRLEQTAQAVESG